MANCFDTIVVGAGVMGCAAGRELARSGRRVLVLEKRTIGHHGGSSHGRTRIIRLSYSDPRYIEMCRASYAAWSALERECNEELFIKTGGLDISINGDDALQSLTQALSECQVSFEVLDSREITKRHPQLRPSARTVAVYQGDGGILHADLCLEALTVSARNAGAVILENTEATDITSHADHISVATPSSLYKADRVVLSTGPAIPQTCRQLKLNLQLVVSMEQVAYFELADEAAYEAARMPIIIIHAGRDVLASVFPLYRDRKLKAMLEWKQPANSLNGDAVDEGRLRALTRRIGPLVPAVSGRPVQVDTCWYTLTPDEHFIVDRHPQDSRITIFFRLVPVTDLNLRLFSEAQSRQWILAARLRSTCPCFDSAGRDFTSKKAT